MVKWCRIHAVMLRHVLQMVQDLSKILDILYWPLVDILLWGLTTQWFKNNLYQEEKIAMMLFSGLVLWGVIWRANVDISLGFLEELWSKNVVNLFSTPLTLIEWCSAMMILGFLRSLFIFFYASAIVRLLYGWNIFSLGFLLIPLFFLLLVSGWSIGFFIAGILSYYGQRIQSLVWAVGWLFSIIGAVFYPLHILPSWLQIICKCTPIVYIFEAMRESVSTGYLPFHYLIKAIVLGIIYMVLSFASFAYLFNKSRVKGLARLEID